MEYVLFIGNQPAWTEQPKQGLTYRRTEETGLLFDRVRSKRGPVDREGSGVPQNRGKRLVLDRVRSKRGPVDREGCGVPQNGAKRIVLERLRSKRGPVDREGCGIPQNGTPRATVHPPLTSSSLHCYCSSTVGFLQPPLAIVHPRGHVHPASPATVHPALHGVLFIQPPSATIQPALHGVLFNQPLHGVMFNQPSTYGVPPPATVHPPPRLLVRGHVHPAATTSTTTGSCSSNPHQELFIKRQLRSASVNSSSKRITRVQLTARDRSGFSNIASAIARVQLEPNASLGFN